MKKMLTILLIISSIFLLTGCGANNNDEKKDNGNNNQPAIETKSKFEQFESALKEKEISFEKTEKSASMVGAKEGYGYIFSDNNSVELYLFDTSSDAYKKVKSSGNMTVEIMEITMPVDYNDGIVIYYNDDVSNKTEIEKIFKDLK